MDKKIIEDLQSTIQNIRKHKKYNMTGYVLIDKNQGQVIGVMKDKETGDAIAAVTYYPYVFSDEENARKNLDFKAKNGLGEIIWQVMKASAYYDLCIERVKKTIESLKNIQE